MDGTTATVDRTSREPPHTPSKDATTIREEHWDEEHAINANTWTTSREEDRWIWTIQDSMKKVLTVSKHTLLDMGIGGEMCKAIINRSIPTCILRVRP
ncbi:hypothetical protein G6F22_018853 [Rhizopus arrhizus]|nr:hypothetical protein G6F22_018853 [Rhizopus arrhizus]KAG0921596.1 hypothetical protein G6F31_020258 [Rhizopus arrhizus]